MRSPVRWLLIATVVACLAAAGDAAATTLVRMNLDDLCDRAGRIFSGTLLEIVPGRVEVGGGEIPTLTYRLEVDETFKGTVEEVKGRRIAEIRMIGKIPPVEAGGARWVPPSLDLPRLEVGRRYLLFATTPSAAGLSTTVGLGQGSFRVRGPGADAPAVNEFDNLGLFEGPGTESVPRTGPVPYSWLAERIRARVAGP